MPKQQSKKIKKGLIAQIIRKRIRGFAISPAAHHAKSPEHITSITSAIKDISVASIVIWLLFSQMQLPYFEITISLFILGWLIWTTCRSAYLSWTRLTRLHKVIEEEKWEIEHHREGEKQELITLYGAKGFSGQLLEDVVKVLMADENRLLQIMIEEEMGIELEKYEHPLKHALGTFMGAFIAGGLIVSSFILFGSIGLFLASILCIIASSTISSRYEKMNLSTSIIWNIAFVGLVNSILYFLLQWIKRW